MDYKYGRRAVAIGVIVLATAAAKEKLKAPKETGFERYIREAQVSASSESEPSNLGSLYATSGHLADAFRDLRAYQRNDLLTIVVSDRASALSKGNTQSQRKSNAKANVTSLLGTLAKTNPLTDLAQLSGDQQLQGQGQTTRENSLSTTLTARVTQVLPNGYLVVEGTKSVLINSEQQFVVVKGIVRPADISPANTIQSNRLAELQVQITGRGVVADAVRRPNFLYRLLLGVLPF